MLYGVEGQLTTPNDVLWLAVMCTRNVYSRARRVGRVTAEAPGKLLECKQVYEEPIRQGMGDAKLQSELIYSRICGMPWSLGASLGRKVDLCGLPMHQRTPVLGWLRHLDVLRHLKQHHVSMPDKTMFRCGTTDDLGNLLDTWNTAYDEFADQRCQAQKVEERIQAGFEKTISKHFMGVKWESHFH